jgi:uncharacterized membrane protein
MQKQEQRLTRMALKYIHTTAVSVWIGGGLAVLVLLYCDWLTRNGDELFALNYAIAAIDDFLIKPAAATTFSSGVLICLLTNWGVFRHRWIVVKLVLTLGALVFGTLCLGPWLKELSLITAADRLAVLDDGGYSRTFRLGAASAILQSVLLFVLVLISIFKPDFAPRKKPFPGPLRQGHCITSAGR